MALKKRGISPLTKGGSVTKNIGKGSQQTTLPARGAMDSLKNTLNPTMNDYAKVDPQSQPAGSPSVPSGLGSGDWPGTLS